MKNILLYCEGTSGSHDYDILNKLLDGLSGLSRVRIEPLGSKKGAGGYIDIHRKKVQEVDFYLFFRDYDFDFGDFRQCDQPISEQLYIDPKRNSDGTLAGQWCVSYRTTIENYLLHPKHFLAFLEEKHKCDELGLRTEDNVKVLFDRVARDISGYQAIRHTLGKLRENLDLGTTWMSKSGKLPTDLNLEFCKKKAMEEISKKQNKVNGWTLEKLEEILLPFIRRFDTPDFYEGMEYLIWFQGKDFARQLRSTIHEGEAFIDEYYKFAKNNIDFKSFPDLNQLREKIDALINE